MKHIIRPLIVAPILGVVLLAAYLYLIGATPGGLCAPDPSGNPPGGLRGAACDALWPIMERNNRERYSKFDKTPPGRQPDTVSDPATGTLPAAVAFEPAVPPIFEWRSRSAPPQPIASGQVPASVTPGGVGYFTVSGSPGPEVASFPPYATLSGYIVARERLADGTVRVAVAITSGTTPFASSDLDKAPLTVSRREAGAQSGLATGLIVWIRLWNALGFTERPLVTDVSWKTRLASASPASAAAAPGPAFEYSRPGDLAKVFVQLQAESYDSQALTDNYRTHQNANGLTYDAAAAAYQSALAGNAATLAHILADAGAKVTLRQELADHRYEFVARSFDFVPGP